MTDNKEPLQLGHLNGATLTWEHPDGTEESVKFDDMSSGNDQYEQ